MTEIRGIIKDFPSGTPRIRIIIRDSNGTEYQKISFPDGIPLCRGTIETFLSAELRIFKGDILWPKHLTIPKMEKKKCLPKPKKAE